MFLAGFESAVVAMVVTIATSYFLGRAGFSRAAVEADGTRLLRYSAVLRTFGGIGGVLLLGLAVWVLSVLPTLEEPLGIKVFLCLVAAGLAFLGVYGAVEFPWVRLSIDESGLVSYTPWRGLRRMAWSEVEDVRFSGSAQWFVIEGAGGQRIRAHLYLVGVRDLYDALVAHVPTERFQLPYDPVAPR